MKVSELFESAVVTEAVDVSISSLLPKVLIGRIFRVFNLDADKATMTKLNARPTTASALKDAILVAKTHLNEWFVAAYNDRSNMSFRDDNMIAVFSNKSSQIQYVSFASLKDMLRENGAVAYWSIPFSYSSSYRMRSRLKGEIQRDKAARKAYDKLVELQQIFGAKYKERALKYVDEIFKNLRILDKEHPNNFQKSQREQALEAATLIEKIIEKDFDRSSMEKFLMMNNQYVTGIDSVAANIHLFNELMTKPAANAKFALTFFTIIKTIYNDVMEMVKDAETKGPK